MNKKRQVAKYLIFDFLAAAIVGQFSLSTEKKSLNLKKFGIDIPIDF